MMQVLQAYCVILTGIRISCYTVDEKGKNCLMLGMHGKSDIKENISNVFGLKQVCAKGINCKYFLKSFFEIANTPPPPPS